MAVPDVEYIVKSFGVWLREGVTAPAASAHPDFDWTTALRVFGTAVGQRAIREIITESRGDAGAGDAGAGVAGAAVVPTSAGLALYRTARRGRGGPSILLVHATGSAWKDGVLSIPKGHVESNESYIAAAVREVSEEVGVDLGGVGGLAGRVSPPAEVQNTDKKGRVVKQLIYFLVNVDDLSIPDVIPKTQLQLAEVDWAGFVPLAEAATRTVKYQQDIVREVERLTGSETKPPAGKQIDKTAKSAKVEAIWKVSPRDRRGGGVGDRKVMSEMPSGVTSMFMLDRGTKAEIDWLYRRIVQGIPLADSDVPASVRARDPKPDEVGPLPEVAAHLPEVAAPLPEAPRDIAMGILGPRLRTLERDGWSAVVLPVGLKVIDDPILGPLPGAKVKQLHAAGVTLAKVPVAAPVPAAEPRTGPRISTSRRVGADWMIKVASDLELIRDATIAHLAGLGFSGYSGTWVDAAIFDPKGHVETTFSKKIRAADGEERTAVFRVAVRRTEDGKLEVRSSYDAAGGQKVVRRWTPLVGVEQVGVESASLFPDDWIVGLIRMVPSSEERLPVSVERLTIAQESLPRLGKRQIDALMASREAFGLVSPFITSGPARSSREQRLRERGELTPKQEREGLQGQSDHENKRLFGQLLHEVERTGHRYNPVLGMYGEQGKGVRPEWSALVYEADFALIAKLARDYDQESLIYRVQGDLCPLIYYRKGENLGKAFPVKVGEDGAPVYHVWRLENLPSQFKHAHSETRGLAFLLDFDWDHPLSWPDRNQPIRYR